MAGKTSLQRYLGRDQQVYMCPISEPHYVSRVGERSGKQHFVDVVSDEASYLSLFEGAAGYPAVGERSCSYLGLEETADAIRARLPEARIMMVLRDPIERAHSHYLMDVRNGLQRCSFHEAVVKELEDPAFGWGPAWHRYTMLYYPGVKRYLDAFGPGRVLVLLTEDLKRDPGGVLKEVARFLGIETEHNSYAAPRNRLATLAMGNSRLRAVGKKFVPLPVLRVGRDRVLFKRQQRPELEARTVEALLEVCAADVESLEALLERPLPELRRSWRVA